MTRAADLLKTGDLASARAQLVEEVKRKPSDPEARLALAEVLMLLGDWERADVHLDLASTQDPSWAQVSALLRQLVRAAAHRDDVFAHGRPPDLVADPTERIEAALRILAEQRDGGGAAALRAEADERFPPLAFTLDDAPVAGVRDLDDRLGDVLELLTSTGKYVWVSFDQVASLELRPPEHPRDRLWRAAELDLVDGTSGVVYLPMIYPAPAAEMTDALRLGKETDWVERGGLNCGLGQKCWLVGDEMAVVGTLGALAAVDTTPAEA